MADRAAAGGSGAERTQWSSRIGFVLAAIGSAVGFGSIARFPMNVAENGGALFVLLYAAIMLLVGVPLLVAELSLGRAAQRNPVGAFARLTGGPTKWRAAGVLYVVVPAFFLSWYAVVSGWTLRYVFLSATGGYFDDPGSAIAAAQQGPDALAWTAAVLVLTLLAVMGGVAKGIERVNLVMMPALFAIVVLLAVYGATLDGVAAGYRFYLTPDIDALSLGVFIAAVGQAFFSLSLGQGAIMTYASYLPRTSSLAANALLISGSTLVFAVCCGLLIFPLLSAFGQLGTGDAGLALIFGPLSQAFADMGSPLGNIVGTLFFSATFFAAFTSAISLCEPAIAYFVEEWGLTRRRASLLVVLAVYTAGVLPSVSSQALEVEGGAITDVLVILGSLLIALFAAWRTPTAVAAERINGGGWNVAGFVLPWLRWALPGVLAVLLLLSLVGTPCVLSGGQSAPGLLEEGVALIGCR